MLTAEPLPGVICPLCHANPVRGDRQTYVYSHDPQAWMCPFCQTPYPFACEFSNTEPRYRDEKNQTPLPRREDKPMQEPAQEHKPTIYVDEIVNWGNKPAAGAERFFGNGKPSCHMSVDDQSPDGLEMLHKFAESIGLKRAWFQRSRVMPHYDLIPSKRALALKKGAQEVRCLDIVKICGSGPKEETPLPKKEEHEMKKRSNPPPPDVMTLSHSQMETWQQCQFKWRLTKLDKVPRAPSEALILGTAFHAALEADGKHRMANSAILQDFQLLGVFDETMQAELAKSDPNHLIPKSHHVAMRAKAQLMIAKYVAIVQPGYKPLAVETEIKFQLGENLYFTGRIDAVTAKGIVDFKTAGKPWVPGIQHGKDQATAYLTAMPEQTKVSFAVFSTDGTTAQFQSLATERTDDQKTDYRDNVRLTYHQIRAAKASGDFQAKVGPLCGWCEVLGSCTAGQAWLKVKGKVPMVPVIQAKDPIPSDTTP